MARKAKDDAKAAKGGAAVLPVTDLVLRGPGDQGPGDEAWLTLPADTVVAYRYMITRLAREAALPQRLGVVAALRQEGVTFTALGLGTTIAHDLAPENRVCVIELNWWWPSTSYQVGGISGQAAGGPGMAGVLSGQATLEQALIHAEKPSVSLLPAGSIPAEDRPVTARSTALRELVDALSRRFAYVVLDVPAILATSDAVPLAGLADLCCLVIRQGVTPLPTLRRALDDVGHLTIAGTILNRTRIATPKRLLRLIPLE
jgi:Mrp family chromosome partitioning ATPase